jgi:hypothetical protein
VKLAGSGLKLVAGVVCGKVRGQWVPGRRVTAGYFLSDAQQAHNFTALASHLKGTARRRYQALAKSYARRARTSQPLCTHARTVTATSARTPATPTIGSAPPPLVAPIASPPVVPQSPDQPPPPTFNGPSIQVTPQFFGQHLMFYWGLNPAIPVHAMRLASSNTDWCQMDHGTASNQYSFGQLYALLGQADRLNADVLYTFASTPAWAASGSYPQPSVTDQCSSSSTTLAPADESYWTKFVTAVVTAAQGRIHAYELWNEVDYSAFWTGGMAAMVRMSIDAAAIIHRIDPMITCHSCRQAPSTRSLSTPTSRERPRTPSPPS